MPTTHQLLTLYSALESLLKTAANSSETRTANEAETVARSLQSTGFTVSRFDGDWYIGLPDTATADVPLESIYS